MEEALRAKLRTTAAVTLIVGQKVDWGGRPEGDTLPALSLRLVDDDTDMKMSGPTGWVSARVEANGWARTYKVARDIGRAVSGTLVGFRGNLSGIPFRILPLGSRNLPDKDEAGPIHRTSVDLAVWYRT
jgi:hypothetical protein